MFANKFLYSDIQPFEVIKQRTDKCIDIRPMRAELSPDFKPIFIPGGFAGTVINQHDQSYSYESIPEATQLTIRLHKNGMWKDAHGGRYILSDKPLKFYDYNF